MAAELRTLITAEDINVSIGCTGKGPDVTKNDAPAEVLSGYRLVFEELFKGQSSLDPAKWSTAFVWGPDLTINNEEVYYVDTLGGTGQIQNVNPFSFGADGLRITAAPITGTKPMTINGLATGQNYTSGIITSRDSISFQGGYIEACLKPPCNADGSWPAFWLLNTMYYDNASAKNNAENGGTGNDKYNPEIDFEWVTGDTVTGTECTKLAYHYHTGDRQGTEDLWTLDNGSFRQVDTATGQLKSQGNIYETCDGSFTNRLTEVCDFNACDAFHTYGLHWKPNDFIDYYIDGQLVGCIRGADNIISDQAMYVLINLTVGGGYPFGSGPTGEPNRLANPADYPASLEVEYVRVYQP